MNRVRDNTRTTRAFGKWAAMLAVPLFLLGTAAFSFLWNVPLNTLSAPRAAASPPEVLLRKTPGNPALRADPDLVPPVLLEHYAAAVTNAGHVSFAAFAPPEVEIRLDHLVIGMNENLVVFNFRTRYGFHLRTCRKPGPRERFLYQWLKTMPPSRKEAHRQNIR